VGRLVGNSERVLAWDLALDLAWSLVAFLGAFVGLVQTKVMARQEVRVAEEVVSSSPCISWGGALVALKEAKPGQGAGTLLAGWAVNLVVLAGPVMWG
jgi:hypothetical protein